MKRGEKLFTDASTIINGERQDHYGNPEDSFETIGRLWAIYLDLRHGVDLDLAPTDVANMMRLMKEAREIHCHKRDNLVDIVGYAGILDDMEQDT